MIPYSAELDRPYPRPLTILIRICEERGYAMSRTPGRVWILRREPTPEGVWFRPEGGRLRLLPQASGGPKTSSSTIGQTH